MEVFVGLSFAFDITQLVNVAKATAESVCQVYEYGTLIDSEEIKDITIRLQSVNLNDTILDSDLSPIAFDLREISDELLDQLESLGSLQKQHFVHKTYQTWRKRGRIEKLQTTLDRYERLLDTGLLAKMSERYRADVAVHSNSFARSDATLQHFIRCLAGGRACLKDVFGQEPSIARQYITRQEEQTSTLSQKAKSIVVTERQKQRFLGSFHFSRMNTRRDQISKAYPKTFEWIFEINTRWPSFKHWLTSSEKVYLIEGKAASGKSTLMRYVADHPETLKAVQAWSPSVKILSHYFWLSGDALQRNMHGFLCSIIYQVLSSDDDALSNCLRHDKHTPDSWSIPELTGLAKTLLSTGSYCFFFDGLDEFDNHKDSGVFRAFIDDLVARPNVKICMSTRPEQSVFVHNETISKIQIHHLTSRDIYEMVVDELIVAQELGHLAADRLEVQLIEEIVDRAQGVFLWVKLALRSVFEGLTKAVAQDELLQRIRCVPIDLTGLYEHLLHQLGDDLTLCRSEASLYLQIVFLGRDIEDVECCWLGQNLMTMTFLVAKHFNQLQDFCYTEEFLSERLRCMARRIQAFSGGLLEVKERLPGELFRHSDCYQCELVKGLPFVSNGKLSSLMRADVVFIHRIARDFVLEQPQGQSILRACESGAIKLLHHLIEVEMEIVSNLAHDWAWDRLIIMCRTINRLHRSGQIDECTTINLLQHLEQSAVRRARQFPGHDPSETNSQCCWLLAKQNSLLHYWSMGCAMDFPGLVIETGSSLYFKNFVKPLLGLDGAHENVLSKEYINYLLLCAMARHSTSSIAGDLLQAGADMYGELYLPLWRPYKVSPAIVAARRSLVLHNCSAKCFDVAAKVRRAPCVLALVSTRDVLDSRNLISHTGEPVYRVKTNTVFELIVEGTMLHSPISKAEYSANPEEKNAREFFVESNHFIHRRVVAVGRAKNEIRQVSSEEDSQVLLEAYDKFCTVAADHQMDFLDRTALVWETPSHPRSGMLGLFNELTGEFHDTIQSVFDHLEPITNWWEFLVGTGHFKESTDPTVPQGPIKRFKDGVDPADYPDF